MLTIANLSGGRDSTAMYEYIEKLDSYLQRNFNKKITWLNKGGKENESDTHTIMEKWAFIKPIEIGKRARLRECSF